MSTRSPRSAGFTLIELLVTLTLMGLALAVAGPALVLPTSHSPAYRDLARALEGARAEAARTGERIELWVDTRNGSHRRAKERNGTGWFGRGSPQSTGGSGPELEHGQWQRIAFDPSGRTTGGSFAVGEGSAARAIISIDRWSGRVHVTPQP